MAVLAPVLAIGRAARAVSGRAAESEFARWFQPLSTRSTHAHPAERRPLDTEVHGAITSACSPLMLRTATTTTIDARRGQDAHAPAWVCLR